MDKNKVNVPKIRFPGFTYPWEQRKLGELLIPSTEKNNTGKYTQDYVLAASLGTELTKKHIFFGLRSTEESIKNYRIVNKGDVIYTKSPIKGYPNGIIKTNKGIEGIVPSLYCVYNSVSDVNSSIIQSYFEDKSRLDAYLYPLVNVGARNNVNITDLGFLEGNICIPHDIDEQNRIVDFIEKLSNLITLHQRKLNHLQDKKKGLLQKMFPQNGKKFPELRFPGFTDPWEQRKFEDIFKLSQGLQIPISQRFLTEGENKYFYITNEFLKSTCDEKYYIENPPQSVICNQEDILMTRTGNTGIVVTDVEGCFHNNFFKIQYEKELFDKHFIVQLLSTESMKRRILNSAGSSTIPDLSHKSFYKLDSLFPKIDEQNKISEFILNLDKIINLHQRKLEHLQQQKKGLLQQMFI